MSELIPKWIDETAAERDELKEANRELLAALIGLREEVSMFQFPKSSEERRTNARIISAEVAIAKHTKGE